MPSIKSQAEFAWRRPQSFGAIATCFYIASGGQKTFFTLKDDIIGYRFRRGETRMAAGVAHQSDTKIIDVTARKSVVSGKSVSVRVDLGGRLIITKKTTHLKSSRISRP